MINLWAKVCPQLAPLSRLDWRNMKCTGGRISVIEEDSSMNHRFDCETGIWSQPRFILRNP